MRKGPLDPARALPAAHAAPEPSAHRRPKETATPAIMITAASLVGAVITAMAASPAADSTAPTISGPIFRLPERSLRNRVAGGVERARPSGASEKAAADSRPKPAAFSSGPG